MALDFTKLKERRLAEEKEFHLIIAGSRSFTPNEYFTERGMTNQDFADFYIKKLLRTRLADGYEIIVHQGGARGADEVGKNFAIANGYKMVEHKADWERYGKAAGFKRNSDMFLSVSLRKNHAAIIFWDGESRGTAHVISLALEYEMQVRCYNFVKKKWLTKEEIEQVHYF